MHPPFSRPYKGIVAAKRVSRCSMDRIERGREHGPAFRHRWNQPMTEQRAERRSLEVINSRSPNVRGVQTRR